MKIKELNELDIKECYIAGGAVLSRVTKNEITDYDVYPKSFDAFCGICENLLGDSTTFIVNISDRAITFKHNSLINDKGERATIQVMYFDSFETSNKIFDFFDFTVCMGAYDTDSESYEFHEDFWADVASKTIRFNPSTKFPLASFVRLNKYRAKGFNIGKGEMTKLALAVANKGLPMSWEELENQMGGVYGKSLSLQVEGIEYSLDKAYKILGNLDAYVEYSEEEYNWFKEDMLRFFDGKEHILYEHTNPDYDSFVTKRKLFYIEDGKLVLFSDFDEELLAVMKNIRVAPISQSPVQTIELFKIVKKVDDLFKSTAHTEKNNGVTYQKEKSVEYDKSPYLSFRNNVKKDFSNRDYYVVIVDVDVSDIVDIKYSEWMIRKCFVKDIIFIDFI